MFSSASIFFFHIQYQYSLSTEQGVPKKQLEKEQKKENQSAKGYNMPSSLQSSSKDW